MTLLNSSIVGEILECRFFRVFPNKVCMGKMLNKSFCSQEMCLAAWRGGLLAKISSCFEKLLSCLWWRDNYCRHLSPSVSARWGHIFWLANAKLYEEIGLTSENWKLFWPSRQFLIGICVRFPRKWLEENENCS